MNNTAVADSRAFEDLHQFLSFRESGNRGLREYNNGNYIYLLEDMDVVIYKKTYFKHDLKDNVKMSRSHYQSVNNLIDDIKNPDYFLYGYGGYRWYRMRSTISPATSVDKLMHRIIKTLIWKDFFLSIKRESYHTKRMSNSVFLHKKVRSNRKHENGYYCSVLGAPLAMQDAHGNIYSLKEECRISIRDYFKERQIPEKYFPRYDIFRRLQA